MIKNVFAIHARACGSVGLIFTSNLDELASAVEFVPLIVPGIL